MYLLSEGYYLALKNRGSLPSHLPATEISLTGDKLVVMWRMVVFPVRVFLHGLMHMLEAWNVMMECACVCDCGCGWGCACVWECASVCDSACVCDCGSALFLFFSARETVVCACGPTMSPVSDCCCFQQTQELLSNHMGHWHVDSSVEFDLTCRHSVCGPTPFCSPVWHGWSSMCWALITASERLMINDRHVNIPCD